ncbi:MAG: endospore germination permease [Marinisporobacter sp.]|jgi:spore germination protein KB|nr:endospore germination permease [Marinisporobacter sp.]
MNKEVISDKQGICLVILFIAGSALAMPTAAEAGSDLWLSIIAAILIAIPIVWIYAKILSFFPEKDLFYVLEYAFGKIIGKMIGFFYIWFAFHLGVLVMRDFGEFPVIVALPETPMIAFSILMVILSIWIVREGIEVLGRWANLFVLINAPIPSILILLLIPVMDFNNIQPILYNGIKPFLEGTLSALSFPCTETVVFMMVFSALQSKKSSYIIYTKGLLWGGLLIAGVSLAEILVIGPDLYGATFFPNHAVASKVDIGETFQRMEIIAIIASITATFLKISVCLFAVCNGVARIFQLKDYRALVVPIGLIMFNCSLFIYENIFEMFEWLTIWKYYAFPFQVILPTMILVVTHIKKNRSAH